MYLNFVVAVDLELKTQIPRKNDILFHRKNGQKEAAIWKYLERWETKPSNRDIRSPSSQPVLKQIFFVS
jgi:hypothetical protein